MSRLPRFQEHLKTGFTAEAVSAARFRAYAARADQEGLPNLARRWRRLAEAKDALAADQLEAAGQVRSAAENLAAALAEERYENDVLYPKMIRQVDGATQEVFQKVVAAQGSHGQELEALAQRLQASQGDVEG